MPGYLTNYGHDANDGLTEETAKKTIQAAINAGFGSSSNRILGAGYFNEYFSRFKSFEPFKNREFIIDGRYITSSTLAQNDYYSGDGKVIVKNCYGELYKSYALYVDFINVYGGGGQQRDLIGNLFVLNGYFILYGSSVTYKVKNNTWFSKSIDYTFSYNGSSMPINLHNIIANMSLNISKSSFKDFGYGLFIGCKFKFTGGGLGYDENDYTYPIGATDIEKINDIRQRMAIVYGGSPGDYLPGCKYYSGSYNDIFIDADNGDFNLVPNCLAAHMSYEGDYIGARPEGVTAKIATDFTTSTNIDANGNITDQNTDAIAITDIQRIGHARKIKSLNTLGQLAKRNGQSANIDADLGAEITAGANKLTAGKVYQAHNDLVVIDNAASTSLNPFETYHAVDEGGGSGLGFSENGVLKEVLIDKYPEKIQLKVSIDDGTLASANLITCFVHRDSGYVMVNYDGNGKPLYGDADAGFDEATAEILVADWWQAFITIKANNLTAR